MLSIATIPARQPPERKGDMLVHAVVQNAGPSVRLEWYIVTLIALPLADTLGANNCYGRQSVAMGLLWFNYVSAYACFYDRPVLASMTYLWTTIRCITLVVVNSMTGYRANVELSRDCHKAWSVRLVCVLVY
jgi:hypothetical protein